MISIVLASQSPARIAVLRAAGIPCEGRKPEVDEAAILDPDPRRLAERRASAKARSIHAPNAIVIGADQVAWMETEAGLVSFGKPRDPVDHAARLKSLRGRRHTLTTAVTLVHPAGETTFHVDTHLWFRADVSDQEIDAYVATGEGSGCAGGYAVEGRGGQLVASIDGDYTNVLGLPLFHLIDALRAVEWRPTFA